MRAPSIFELKQNEENQQEVNEMFISWFKDQKGKLHNEFRIKKASVIKEEFWRELQIAIQDALDIEDTNRILVREI